MISYEEANEKFKKIKKISNSVKYRLLKKFNLEVGIEALIQKEDYDLNNLDDLEIIFLTYPDRDGVEKGSKLERELINLIEKVKGNVFLVEYPKDSIEAFYSKDLSKSLRRYIKSCDSLFYEKILRPAELVRIYGNPIAIFPCDERYYPDNRKRDINILAMTVSSLHLFKKVIYVGGRTHADFFKYVFPEIKYSHYHISHKEDANLSSAYWWKKIKKNKFY